MRLIEKLMRAKWDPKYKKLSDFKIVVRHHGAPNDMKIILGKSITKIQKDGFWYINNLGDEIFIPAHRIIELKVS